MRTWSNTAPRLPSRSELRPTQRSKHGHLGVLLGRAVAVLEQPAAPNQAPPRPPCADHAAVDIGAIAGEDVVKVLLVREGEGGDVVQRVALGRLRPVENAGDLVTVGEDVFDV